MKIAIVEKSPSRVSYHKYFDFDYDKYALTKSKKQKINKADVTLDFKVLEDYDYVVCVGAEPCKHLAKVAVTKYAGHLVNEKYFPMLNPAAVMFNPDLKATFDSAVDRMLKHMDGTYKSDLGQYTAITSATQLKRYLKKILQDRSIKNVAIDTETSSFSDREGHVLGICMSYKEHEGVYIDSNCIDDACEVLFQQVFNAKNMVFWNAKFDLHWMEYHFNWKFPNWDDAMLMHYLLNENEAHDLKSVVMKYTDMGDYDWELDAFKRKDSRQRGIPLKEYSYQFIPFDIMSKYGAADADATIRLFNKFDPIIQSSFARLYNEIIKKGIDFLKQIEEIGVPFSKKRLLEVRDILEDDIDKSKEAVYKYPEIHKAEKIIGEKFNPNSTKHLIILFYDVLGLPITKLTDGGVPSTDKEVLATLSELHEIPKHIKSLRSLIKLKSTYIDKVIKEIHTDGRLRTGFHLHTTTSGRLSSSGKLNMQQLPRDDKLVKSCIQSPYDGWCVYSQDLQTAEMYYAAVLSGDKALARVFESGGDFHSTVAKMVFKLPCEVSEVKFLFPDLRQAAKAISFGILYGAGPQTVADSAGCTVEEAQGYIKEYFRTFRRLADWLKEVQTKIKAKGYIYSEFGRKRRVKNVFSVSSQEQGHAVRSAVNFLIQSVSSDVNLIAAINVQEWIVKSGFPAEVFALVHDSVIGVVRADMREEFEAKLKEITQRDVGLTLKSGHPIGVDFGYGASYAEAG
jgi:DNA polymerase I-like protein with 3'-5' exonuclease and polymerase domains